MARKKKTKKTEESEQNIINRADFLTALQRVKPGLANKELIEQSTHFIFDNDKIYTYNAQVHLMYRFKSNISGAVKADKFYKLLEKIPNDEISISAEKGKIKLLAGDNIKAEIKIDPDIKIKPIQIPGINSQKWEELPDNFHDAIALTTFAASKNMIRPELCCLYIVDDIVIGCDTFRGTKYKLSSKMKQTFLMPAVAAVELAKYNPYKVLYEDGWVHFINSEKTTFSCRTISQEYPEEIWKFFKVEGKKIELPEDFVNTIERAQVMITADFDLDKVVTLIMENNEVVCKSSGDYGNFYERADIDYDGEKISINVHPLLLKEILRYLQVMIIGDRLLFVGENFEHAVCLSI